MSIPNDELLLKLAHDLIGVRGIYQGREYAGPSVVLEPTTQEVEVQNTAQGEAKRYAQSNYTIPMYSEVRKDLHPVLVDFLGQEICNELRKEIK